jgi:hypothetical protein
MTKEITKDDVMLATETEREWELFIGKKVRSVRLKVLVKSEKISNLLKGKEDKFNKLKELDRKREEFPHKITGRITIQRLRYKDIRDGMTGIFLRLLKEDAEKKENSDLAEILKRDGEDEEELQILSINFLNPRHNLIKEGIDKITQKKGIGTASVENLIELVEDMKNPKMKYIIVATTKEYAGNTLKKFEFDCIGDSEDGSY